jgi:actin-like ATPase involved in cell morphogenesis
MQPLLHPAMNCCQEFRRGVVVSPSCVSGMRTPSFVRKACGRGLMVKPCLVIGVPPEITPVERRAVKDRGLRAKASEVHLVDEPMAAAIGGTLLTDTLALVVLVVAIQTSTGGDGVLGWAGPLLLLAAWWCWRCW